MDFLLESIAFAFRAKTRKRKLTHAQAQTADVVVGSCASASSQPSDSTGFLTFSLLLSVLNA
jgi:hypothetical protein